MNAGYSAMADALIGWRSACTCCHDNTGMLSYAFSVVVCCGALRTTRCRLQHRLTHRHALDDHVEPPSSQFRLVRIHVAARAVLALAAARATVLVAISRAAAASIPR